MKRYSLSLTVSWTEEQLKEAELSHLTEKEIEAYMEEEFNDLINSRGFLDTEFKVEEV